MKAHTRIIEAVAKAWGYLTRQEQPQIDIGDVQFVAGFSALIYGLSMVSVPGAWMTAGALLLTSWGIPRIRFPRGGEKE